MKALSLTESFSIRVLSARMLPPVRGLLGSTASTATRSPFCVSIMPKLSMKVLLPAPGTPVIPRRTALPVWGSSASMTARAVSWWAGRVLSISVIVFAMTSRFWLATPWT